MASTAYMVIVHDDGRPTEVVTPDSQMGVLFPRAGDDGDLFYGKPEVLKAVFRKHEDGKLTFVVGGMSVEQVRDQMLANGSLSWEPGCEDWVLVERVTVTLW